MKKLILLFLIIFLLSSVCALCNETQININTASLEELMKIRGLGGEGIIAGRVIENRPYNSLDELLEVKGIGNITLEKIKAQGLACVGGNIPEDTDAKTNEITKENKVSLAEEDEPTNTTIYAKISSNLNADYSEKEITTINLTPANSKNIKSEDNKENLIKSNYAFFGIVAFCAIFGLLFLIKKRKEKNELQ